MTPARNLNNKDQSLLSTPQAPLCHIVTPIGMLGYGFDAQTIYQCLSELKTNFPDTPTALIVDSGSTDSGPSKLALGGMTCPRSAYERDIGQLMRLSHQFSVPILISSAGGDGTDAHVDEFLAIIQEHCDKIENEAYRFKTLAIYSNISKHRVFRSLDSGSVTGCGSSVPSLTIADIDDALTIVAQMGPEPFLDAVNEEPDFDIVIGGRAYDPVPYVVFSTFHARRELGMTLLTDFQIGGFTHMGKVMECGALCATPKAHASMASVYLDGSFDIKPLDFGARCTPASVAAHTLYEKSRPDLLAGPCGSLDLTATRYTQLSDNIAVHVNGATFAWVHDSGAPYTVKLEAAKMKGHRTIVMGGVRDPILIGQIDSFLARIKDFVRSRSNDIHGEWRIDFHVYGSNGIMGSLDPGNIAHEPREIFIVGEALAQTQAAANSIASTARVGLVHGFYPGQRGTGGNLAMGIGGKMEIEMGPCAEFCIYHLMELTIGTEGARKITGSQNGLRGDCDGPVFSWRVMHIGKGLASTSKSAGCFDTFQPLVEDKRITSKSLSTDSRSPRAKLIVNSSMTLADIAPVIRSKNSGPYDITLDVVFANPTVYDILKKSDLLNRTTIAQLYHLNEADLIWCGFFDQALAFKATIPRMRNGKPISSGAYMETDVHASQQYAGLLDLKLGDKICEELSKLDMEVLD
ncbi:uncharacterized protein RAG0_17249 [Rhynchosporium agropyri]|uniref:DUF1446 domain protein n=1 Tax=Rhynchosporium agropyri TaxID=914238 RepID=A0A1E1LTC6_9HELO|nr:uncharacterized protein RAG0_17249 [Rhynchosporium agropyri]